jgi:hypothetical protein
MLMRALPSPQIQKAFNERNLSTLYPHQYVNIAFSFLNDDY